MSPLARAGVCFTPPALARRLASGLPDHGGVLDPACGEGELLLAAWERRGRTREAAEALHGIEVAPELARRARGRLREAIGGAAGEAAARRVVTGDALDGRTWPAGTAVAANPPWASLSGRQAVLLEPRQEALARALGGWPSLHGAFLERIARHVGGEGSAARVLVPAPVCELAGYGALREAVGAAARLAAPPELLDPGSFPGISEPAALLSLGPGDGAPGSPAPWRPAAAGLVVRLAGFPRLPAASFGDPGVHTGNAAAELVRRGDVAGLPGVREGRDLAAFALGPPRAGLVTDLERTAERRFRIGPLERYRGIPVLLRQTADRPVAALHERPTYFRNSLLACAPPPGLDPACAVAVLNSEVLARWHRLSFADARQRSFPQVKVGHLRALPFPLATRADDPALHDRLAELTRRLSARGGDDPGARTELERRVAAAFGVDSAASRGPSRSAD